MTVVAGHNRSVAQVLTSLAASVLVLLPSLATLWCLQEGELPLQPAMKISCLILFLASINFATAIMLEPYRSHFSKLSPPAVISMAVTVFLFITLEALKTYFPEIGYKFLLPLLLASGGLIYAAVFREKSLPLKVLLSLDSIALMFLWALAASDKFTMPF